jgi:tRNA C32,U32 (ribose-2'-O)-methylase TrmJ
MTGVTRRDGQDRQPPLTPRHGTGRCCPAPTGRRSHLFGAKDWLSRGSSMSARCSAVPPAHPDYGSFNLAQAVPLVT